MYTNLRSQKGFTVVELMIAVLIAGMITVAISSYLLAHIKAYKASEDIIDLQYDGQVALNQISKIAMESTGLSHLFKVEAGGIEADQMTEANGVVLENIGDTFAFHKLELDGTDGYYIFTLRADGVLEYSQSVNDDLSSPTDVSIFARNIRQITITPGKSNKDPSVISSEENFSDTKSVDIGFYLENDGSDLIVTTQAMFRNKKK